MDRKTDYDNKLDIAGSRRQTWRKDKGTQKDIRHACNYMDENIQSLTVHANGDLSTGAVRGK